MNAMPKPTSASPSQPPAYYEDAVHALRAHADPNRARTARGYFKDPGDDIFLGVPSALIGKTAREFQSLPLSAVRKLMRSRVHEERSLAHAILRGQFQKGNEATRQRVFDFYVRHRGFIRSWDGVDDSAPYIVGAHLLARDKALLYQLARADRIWDRRIAIVSTWWFIRNGDVRHTMRLAKMLLSDKEDLIHKAVGWMLREAGKRDIDSLKTFLKKHHRTMPRTMLRYAIERFPGADRQRYLKGI